MVVYQYNISKSTLPHEPWNFKSIAKNAHREYLEVVLFWSKIFTESVSPEKWLLHTRLS